MTLGRGPLGEERLLTVHIMVSLNSQSLEGDRGRDRVRCRHLLTSFQEGLEGDRGSVRVQWCRLFQERYTRNCSFKNFFIILQVRRQTIL